MIDTPCLLRAVFGAFAVGRLRIGGASSGKLETDRVGAA